mmetsp:Transcript_6357/g.15337  ORF Transcript_6357/g.15337 Transcript_6357/m.15337 type:complete len:205 (+) Transcript_6357:852-1466(+)
MLMQKKTCATVGPRALRLITTRSSSPSPLPVRLSPLWLMAPASECGAELFRLPKNTASRKLACVSNMTALQSRSTVPNDVSQPSPHVILGSAEEKSTTEPFDIWKLTRCTLGAWGIICLMTPLMAGSTSMKCRPCAGASMGRMSHDRALGGWLCCEALQCSAERMMAVALPLLLPRGYLATDVCDTSSSTCSRPPWTSLNDPPV